MSRNELILDALIVAVTLMALALLYGRSVSMSDPYSFNRGLSPAPLLFSLCIVPPALLLYFLTNRYAARNPAPFLLAWYALGSACEVAFYGLYVRPFSEVLKFNRYTMFVREYSLGDLLRHYDTISSSYNHPNIRNNMPGKAVMMKLLEGLTGNLVVRGIALVLISNLGVFLIYLICMKLFKNRKAAATASVLYLFLPARIFFLTQPNVITPVLILACFLLLLLYLEKGRALYAILFGLAAYLLTFFEATPLVLLLVFAAFVLKAFKEGGIDARGLSKGAFFALLSFVLVFLVFLVAWDYNIVSSVTLKYSNNWEHISRDAPYLYSLASSIREFFVSFGLAQSVCFLFCCGSLLANIISRARDRRGDLKEYLLRPSQLILSSTLLSLLVLDLLGVNRVETARTWIYMMVFAIPPVALFLEEKDYRLTRYLVISSMILQAAVSIAMISYV